METSARRDELLDQVLALPIEARDCIEAAIVREAYEPNGPTLDDALRLSREVN